MSVVLLPSMIVFAQYAEPHVFPVIKDVRWIEVDGNWTVSFNKDRDCDLEGVYWFDGRTWSAQRFVNAFSRPPGPAVIENYPAPPGVDLSTDISVVRHKCHGLWYLETVFKSKPRA